MNKKGFTLVELLGVLVLLIIIFMVVYPNVSKVIDSGEDTTYKKQINAILSAAYDWSLGDTSRLPEGSNKTYVTLAELKNSGLVDANITDPKTREPFSNDLVISISYVGFSYSTTSNSSKKYGDYLYNIDNLPTYNEISQNPTIELDGLVKNSSGNYVTNVDLNSEFKNSDYTATSNDGVDLTDRVIINIMHNGNAVDLIDTSKVGIYYINYTVVDDNGNSTTAVRNVIVSDISAPEINIIENNTVALGSQGFDLMDGVSCSDNSGNCDISVVSDDSFNTNVKDKYVIEYSAKDFSGNTNTKKRVVTVE